MCMSNDCARRIHGGRWPTTMDGDAACSQITLGNFVIYLLFLLQWHDPKKCFACRWYVARAHDRCPSSTAGWVIDTDVSRLYISINHPSARWYVHGAIEVSSSCLVVLAPHALITRWWSCLESERATWPKKRSRLQRCLWSKETEGHP